MNFLKKHIKILGIIVFCLVIAIISMVLILGKSDKDLSAKELSSRLIEVMSDLTLGQFSDNDRKGSSDAEHSYISKATLFDSTIGNVSNEENNLYSISIEVFDNNQQAELRKIYLEKFYEISDNYITVDDIGQAFYNEMFGVHTNNYLYGNVLLRLNINYTEAQAKDIKDKFEVITNNYKQTQKGIVSKADFNILKEQKLESLKVSLEKTSQYIMDSFNEALDEIIKEMDSKTDVNLAEFEEAANFFKDMKIVSEKFNEVHAKIKELRDKKVSEFNLALKNLEKSLIQADYNDLLIKVENITNSNNSSYDSYYDDYAEEWNNTLEKIQGKIKAKEIIDYKNESKKLNYKDILRNPSSYEGKKAYWFGKVLQVVDKSVSKTTMRVGVNCHKYSYIKGYYCDDTIYVYYYGSESLIEDDMIKMWGTMDGAITYTTVMGAKVTIPAFIAKYIEI